MKTTFRNIFAGLAAAVLVVASLAAQPALAASALVISTGTTFLPGFRMVDGTDLNTLLASLNVLRNQADGTTASTDTGTFNGQVGNTTPASGAFTTGTFSSTLASTGVYTPTGGIAAAGGFANSCRLMSTGNEAAIATTSGTNLDIVTTETYRAEVFVPANCSSTGVAIFNGTAVAGNVQAYLITAAGAQVTGVLTASTAQAGTTAYQLIPWAGGPYTILGPATYYIAVQGNNASGDLRTHTVGTFGADKQTGTTYGTLTVATSPTTFTTGLGPIANLY